MRFYSLVYALRTLQKHLKYQRYDNNYYLCERTVRYEFCENREHRLRFTGEKSSEMDELYLFQND